MLTSRRSPDLVSGRSPAHWAVCPRLSRLLDRPRKRGSKMQKSMTSDPRISSMLGTDRMWSVISILVLWLLYAFVFWAVRDETGTPEVLWALVISGGLVILFNTAAIVAMLTHLNEAR